MASRKTKGIVAGVAGGALLLGAGGTFSLWADQEQHPGGTITPGHLNVDAGPVTWYDSSPDRLDPTVSYTPGIGQWQDYNLGQEATWNGVSTDFAGWSGEIEGLEKDPNMWRIVPGDQFFGLTTVKVQTEGDNMRAHLRVETPGVSGDLAEATGLRYLVVRHGGGQEMGEARPLNEPVDVPVEGTYGDAFEVLIIGDFSENISGGPGDQMSLMGPDTMAQLDNLTVTLEQVR
ncbi:SipW-dependent-type signal peptide-containing protein [Isoptericola sp. NPDC057653]|uniref:SipW-dependent-type signal peptide-containing protein n=1 Tax=Isoptericola sp. NPDC057653 TaxID=3346195 RepID=UPI0036BA63A0